MADNSAWISMVRKKISRQIDQTERIYSKSHWKLLKDKRDQAKKVMSVLPNLDPLLYGSLARGDTHANSDVDIFIEQETDEYRILPQLSKLGMNPSERLIIQATPLSALKAHLVFDLNLTITYPLVPLYPREEEFYKFGGTLNLNQLCQEIRRPGVNKELLLIEPTENGHIEIKVEKENASIIAKKLDISIATVLERVRVLKRRDKIGRTGTFLKYHVPVDMSFGESVSKLVKMKPATRRRYKRKKL